MPRHYAREFLGGSGGRRGSGPKWGLGVRSTNLPPAPDGKRVHDRAVVPGWLRTPEIEDEADAKLREKIDKFRKDRKRYSTIAKILNEDGDYPRFGKIWHATGVEKFFTGRIESKKSRLRILGSEYAVDDLAEENQHAHQWLPESADFTERLRVMQEKSSGAFQTWLRGLPAAAQLIVTQRLANPITVQVNHPCSCYCRLTPLTSRVLEQPGMSAWTIKDGPAAFRFANTFVSCDATAEPTPRIVLFGASNQ